jgi:PAS domain S-box-containing protein
MKTPDVSKMDTFTQAAAEHGRQILHANVWLAAIIADSDDAIISKALDGTITSWNRGAQRLFGFAPEDAIGKSITIIIPEERWSEEDTIIGKVRSGERVDHFETVRRTQTGELIDVAVTVSPVRGPDGTIMGASKILRDITERNRASERQSLLLREMNHRIKNLFALVGGLVAMTARTSSTVMDMADKLDGRISSLARAHSLTLPGNEENDGKHGTTTLSFLLKAILEPYADQCRISFSEKDITVSGSALTSIALLLHELATNAAKYGSLSVHQGQLAVAVSHVADTIELAWIETGGPRPDVTSGHQGFGTKLETASLRSLSGEIERHWHPTGLALTLRLPTHRLAD